MFFMASTLVSEGKIPVLESRCPRNSREGDAKMHFDLFSLIPVKLRISKPKIGLHGESQYHL